MTERRENRIDAFAREIERRLRASLLEVQSSSEMETVVNGAMDYALLYGATLAARGREADEPSAANRERFNQKLDDHAAQAAAV